VFRDDPRPFVATTDDPRRRRERIPGRDTTSSTDSLAAGKTGSETQLRVILAPLHFDCATHQSLHASLRGVL